MAIADRTTLKVDGQPVYGVQVTEKGLNIILENCISNTALSVIKAFPDGQVYVPLGKVSLMWWTVARRGNAIGQGPYCWQEVPEQALPEELKLWLMLIQ